MSEEIMVKNSTKLIIIITVALTSYFFSWHVARAGLLVKQPTLLGLTNGLVGYWTFDGPDTTATTAIDKSGQGNNGTLTNSPTAAIGRIGQALKFDGVSAYVDMGNPTALQLTGSATWSAWVKPNNPGNGFDQVIINKRGGAGARGWELAISSGCPCPFMILVASDTNTLIERDSNITQPVSGQWTHVVGVYNASLATLDIYINGLLNNGTLTGTVPSSQFNSAQNVLIGRQSSAGNTNVFTGAIDDVRVYNRALSAVEIQRLYNLGVATKVGKSQTTALTNGLVGYWTFDGPDISGTTAIDRSGQGNNGTLTSSPAKTLGKIGQALSFDDVASYVNVPNAASLGITGDISIAGWIKRTGITNHYDPILAKTNGNNRWDYDFLLCDNISICIGHVDALELFSDATTPTAVFSTGLVNDTAWHHVAVTRSGSTATFYIDGASSGTATWSGAFNNNPDPVRIGTDGPTWGAASLFGGNLDDIRIYNRALSAVEIQRLYNLGVATKVGKSQTTALTNGLVGYWTFDGPDTTATTAIDKSGQGNNGTLVSSPTATAGKIGQALKFDASTNYVDIGNAAVLKLDPPFTISAWVQIRDVDPVADKTYTVISKWNSGGAQKEWQLWVEVGKFDFCKSQDGSTNISADCPGSNTAMKVNVWTHGVFVVNASGNYTFYTNGVSDGTGTLANTTTFHGTASVNIGRNASANQYFAGTIDDVRIYNRALSAVEIQRLYNLGR